MVNLFSSRVPKPFSGERIIFSTNGMGSTGYHMQNSEVGPLPHINTKINSKQINDLNIKAETTKLLEKQGESS